ncbi:transcriptional regulator, AlpA family [Modicisalibacter ilicicola DSM 19980]|uniref:Transcriptional regulator, AlpA family n=1 Tax=Modicisalibacter ilicicola DSM 19980 TaxID=1121942 RepID=A0A1M4UUC5_9GAMM|nr:DNA-binding protein [Halomonas ilicicola]SHE60279.1 transcriptional regulator, AlpA family [Halomonas ilicicola DSM 19980]
MEYIFTLKYRLTEQDTDTDALIERLGEAGCDDALIGIGQPGRLALEFTREADDAWQALCSALADVKQALPTVRLIEVTPDFVGLTDVAEMVGMSRQNLRKLMLANPDTFPDPVHEGNASLWHLSDILTWLDARGSYALEPSVMDIASAALQVNLFKLTHRQSPEHDQELEVLVS